MNLRQAEEEKVGEGKISQRPSGMYTSSVPSLSFSSLCSVESVLLVSSADKVFMTSMTAGKLWREG